MPGSLARPLGSKGIQNGSTCWKSIHHGDIMVIPDFACSFPFVPFFCSRNTSGGYFGKYTELFAP